MKARFQDLEARFFGLKMTHQCLRCSCHAVRIRKRRGDVSPMEHYRSLHIDLQAKAAQQVSYHSSDASQAERILRRLLKTDAGKGRTFRVSRI